MEASERTLRLSRRHLLALGRAWRSHRGPGEPGLVDAADPSGAADMDRAVAELGTAGMLEADGRPVALLEPVAAAAATVRVQLEVARVRGGRVRQVLLQWSPEGLLAVPGGPLDRVGDVAFQRPNALARTLWRLLRLGPRTGAGGHRPMAGPLTTGDLLAALGEGPTPWVRALGATDVSLDRVDVRTAPGPPLVSLALVDSTAGLWDITGDGDEGYHLCPTDPVTVYTVFVSWQETLVARSRASDPA